MIIFFLLASSNETVPDDKDFDYGWGAHRLTIVSSDCSGRVWKSPGWPLHNLFVFCGKCVFL